MSDVLQLSDGRKDGVCMGQSATDKIAFFGGDPATQASAMTAALTTITFTEPATPDYAIQAPTNTSPYGFVTSDEARTMIKVVANLQTRVNELEAIVERYKLAAAN